MIYLSSIIYRRCGLGITLSSNEPPAPKRRKSERIAGQLSKEVDGLSKIADESSLEVHSNIGNKEKDSKRQHDVISHKNDFKKVRSKSRGGLRLAIKQNETSSPVLFSSKSE